MKQITLILLKDGPIIVQGAISIIAEEEGSRPLDPETPIALCRCGRSGTNPSVMALTRTLLTV